MRQLARPPISNVESFPDFTVSTRDRGSLRYLLHLAVPCKLLNEVMSDASVGALSMRRAGEIATLPIPWAAVGLLEGMRAHGHD